MTAILKRFVMAVLAFAFAASPAWATLTSLGETYMTFDSQEDIEPAVISQNVGATEYDIAVWMRFDPNIQTATSTLYYSVKHPDGTSVASGQIPVLPPPTTYVRYADPILTTSGSRTFLTAVVTTSDETDGVVAVWYSDDQGQSWSHTGSPAIVTGSFNGGVVDKPTCTVAPNGTVYVSHVIHGGQNTIWAESGTQKGDGSWNWSAPARVGTSTLAQSPSILVDSSNNIYVVFMNFTTPQIELWQAPAGTLNFTSLSQTISTPHVFGGIGDFFLTLDTTVSPAVSVRATTIPVARIDRTNNRIAVMWHEGDGNGHILMHFSAIRLNDPNNPVQWRTITVGSTGDANINAGMDHDGNGGYLVTYYHFSTSGTSSVYTTYGAYVSFGANEVPASDSNQTVTGRTGSPAYYTDTLDNQNQHTGHRFLGDYHDVYFSNGNFKVCGILVNGWGDPWIYTITHS